MGGEELELFTHTCLQTVKTQRGRESGNVRLHTSTGSQSIMVIPTDKTVNSEDRQDLCGHKALAVYTAESSERECEESEDDGGRDRISVHSQIACIICVFRNFWKKHNKTGWR